jgi:Fungal specific transcription factor domain
MSTFEQSFVSCYMHSYGPGQNNETPPFWVSELPHLVSSPTTMPTVHCIRAVALLFYGNLTDNIALQIEAYRWYGTALRSLRRIVQKYGTMSNSQSNPLLTDSLVCAPILLFCFQVMIGSALHTWMPHLTAANCLLWMQGFEKCRKGLSRRFFLAVRLLTVRISYLEIEDGNADYDYVVSYATN